MSEELDRRTFLSRATIAIAGVITVGMGVPAFAFFVSPASKQETTSEWLALGSPNQVEIGVPTLFKGSVEKTSGWVTSTAEVDVYIETENGQEFDGLSNICTHLGCRVRWVEDDEQFFCPCHGGVFSKTGEVLDGPPPRPLDNFEVRVTDGVLEAKYSG